jgi:hypothetical protein
MLHLILRLALIFALFLVGTALLGLFMFRRVLKGAAGPASRGDGKAGSQGVGGRQKPAADNGIPPEDIIDSDFEDL